MLSWHQSCLSLCNSMDCNLPDSPVHGDSPGKNIGAGHQALLQGTFWTPGSNLHQLHLRHCRQVLYPQSYLGSPEQPGTYLKYVVSLWHHALLSKFSLPLFTSKLIPLDCKYRNQMRLEIIVTEFGIWPLMTLVISEVFIWTNYWFENWSKKSQSQQEKKKHTNYASLMQTFSHYLSQAGRSYPGYCFNN